MLLVTVCTSFQCLSQEYDFISITKIDTKNGLSSLNVRKIIRDKYGFIWLGTQDGLSRYDGRSFINFNSNSADSRLSILGSDVFDIAFDESGDNLWVLSAYGGLSRIDVKNCSVVETVSFNTVSSSPLWLKCMDIKKGNIYIGSNEGIIITYNLKTKKINGSSNIGNTINDVAIIDEVFADETGRVWIFLYNKGVLVYDKDLKNLLTSISTEQLETKPQTNLEIFDFSVYKKRIFLATTAGLRVLSIDEMKIIKDLNSLLPSEIMKEEVNALSITENSLLIAGKKGMYRVNISNYSHRSIVISKNYEDKDWLQLSNSVFEFGQNIWIGSQYGLAFVKNKNSPFTGFYSSMNGNNKKIQHSLTLLPINDSILYTCSDNGLYRVNYMNSSIHQIGNSDLYYTIFKGPNNDFIASGVKANIVIDENNIIQPISTVYPELKSLKNDLFISVASLSDSLFFLGSQYQNGLFIWNVRLRKLDTISTSTKLVQLRSNVINRVYISKEKNIWILCDNIISIYNPFSKNIKHLELLNPQNQEPLNILMDICEFQDSYWLAAYGTGIIKLTKEYKIEKIYSSKDGINNLGLYKIFKLNDSNLIISSNFGLSILNSKTGKASNYFESDGLHSNNFEETSGGQFRNLVFLGGMNGFTLINSEKFLSNSVRPKLYLNKIYIQTENFAKDTVDLLLEKLKIPNNNLQTTIAFSALNFVNPERTTFSYKINEVHSDWIHNGTQNFISLLGLSAGTYHLEVQAFNEDGVPSEIKELTLIFLPKWYQTWQFKVLIVLIILAIVYGLYRMRINQLKKEEKIRNQVAGDLHDELGSTLNSVKIFANLALLEKDNTTHLEKIKESTQSAISGVKDIIWVLDDKRDSLDHLLGRINQFARPICEAAGISYKQQSGGNDNYKLGKEEKRNLYMIIKESINNSIKYADCSVIELLIKNNGGKLNISISDNGKGFDKHKIESGYGLRNIIHRSKEIEYHAEINSSPGNGTLIYLEKK